jgi:hypothetical protein
MFLGHEHYFQLPIEYFKLSIFDLGRVEELALELKRAFVN